MLQQPNCCSCVLTGRALGRIVRAYGLDGLLSAPADTGGQCVLQLGIAQYHMLHGVKGQRDVKLAKVGIQTSVSFIRAREHYWRCLVTLEVPSNF